MISALIGIPGSSTWQTEATCKNWQIISFLSYTTELKASTNAGGGGCWQNKNDFLLTFEEVESFCVPAAILPQAANEKRSVTEKRMPKRKNKDLVNEILQDSRAGEPFLPALLALPLREAALGGPLTFITFREWRDMFWPNCVPAREAGRDLDSYESARIQDILFGAWLSWRSQYFSALVVLRSRKIEVSVRRLNGEEVRDVLMEKEYFLPLPRGKALFASLSPLADPLIADGIPACIACVLHDERGNCYAQAVAWNTGSRQTPMERAVAALVSWAKEACGSALGSAPQLAWVFEDPEREIMFSLSPHPVHGGIAAPCADLESAVPFERAKSKKTGTGTGKVVPFRPRHSFLS